YSAHGPYAYSFVIQGTTLSINMSSRVAVVTGGNKGIGFCIVKFLCQKFDGDVYLTARDEKRGNAAVAELNKMLLHPKFHQLDIDDLESIRKFRDHLKQNYEGLDVLVNNAGIAYKDGATLVYTVGEQFCQCSTTANLGSLTCSLSSDTRPHASTVLIQIEVGRNYTMGTTNTMIQRSADITKRGVSVRLGFVFSEEGGRGSFVSTPACMNNAACTVPAQHKSRSGSSSHSLRIDPALNVTSSIVTCKLSNVFSCFIPFCQTGADAPTYLALLPPNVKSPRGEFVWNDRKVVPWNGD
ncbi:unnamed protein product, partial [Ixodes pacificus]